MPGGLTPWDWSPTAQIPTLHAPCSGLLLYRRLVPLNRLRDQPTPCAPTGTGKHSSLSGVPLRDRLGGPRPWTHDACLVSWRRLLPPITDCTPLSCLRIRPDKPSHRWNSCAKRWIAKSATSWQAAGRPLEPRLDTPGACAYHRWCQLALYRFRGLARQPLVSKRPKRIPPAAWASFVIVMRHLDSLAQYDLATPSVTRPGMALKSASTSGGDFQHLRHGPEDSGKPVGTSSSPSWMIWRKRRFRSLDLAIARRAIRLQGRPSGLRAAKPGLCLPGCQRPCRASV